MKMLYKPYCKSNHLICGWGRIAIVTGWTVKESVAKYLSKSEYAVIGNLYSATRGISPLIRNLLANPQVCYLVILIGTKEDKNAGSCQCLWDFFENGFSGGESDTGKSCWVINSQVRGYIDAEIEEQALTLLRKEMGYKVTYSLAEAINIVKALSKETYPIIREQLYFPENKAVAANVLPGPFYGHRIEGKNIAETWVKILQRIRNIGRIRPTLYGEWQELIDLTAIVTDEPENFYFPEPNYLPIKREFIQDYISQILDDAPQTEGVKYTYGQRLRSWFGRDQVQQAINKLIEDKDSARAVMSLWDVQDYNSDNPPCLNLVWVRIANNELSLTATFRSNDMFSAWPANAMGLRALQRHIFMEVVKQADYNLKLGALITISQSAHIYDDCWEQAEQVIEQYYQKICRRKDFDDPAGSFLISLQDDKIMVEQITPGSGEVVNCYSGKSAQKLREEIAITCPYLQAEHALYLGTELQKAELALSHPQTFNYQQDKPLKIDN